MRGIVAVALAGSAFVAVVVAFVLRNSEQSPPARTGPTGPTLVVIQSPSLTPLQRRRAKHSAAGRSPDSTRRVSSATPSKSTTTTTRPPKRSVPVTKRKTTKTAPKRQAAPQQPATTTQPGQSPPPPATTQPVLTVPLPSVCAPPLAHVGTCP
jgi:hypothetical protein